MNTLKISIIIPVYNVEKYIRKCIDSVLAQSYYNFELILIDDGSNDKSGKICDNYALKDCRIKVYHKENSGTSKSRNIGIKKANGEWITFIDSDDFVDINYLLSMIEQVNYQNTNKCLIVQGCKIIRKDKIRIFSYNNEKVNKNIFILDFSQKETYKHGSPWGKLFNKNIILKHDIYFNERLSNYEDLLFCMSYMLYIDYIIYINDTNYYYRILKNSLARRYQGFNNELFLLEQYSHTLTLIRKIDPTNKNKSKADEYKNEFIYRMMLTLYNPQIRSLSYRRSRLKYIQYHYGSNIDITYFNKYNKLTQLAIKMLLRRKILCTDYILILYTIIKKIKND